MNQMQIFLFVAYFLSLFISGIGIYGILSREGGRTLSRTLLVGEACLLGAMCLVGELLMLSFVGLYTSWALWGVVLLNYLFLAVPGTRAQIMDLLRHLPVRSLSFLGFILLLSAITLRNCYPMFDVDSLVHYLFTQKVWLAAHSSLVGDPTFDSTLFAPQFDFVPAALGISLFPRETFFPELVNLSWRLIVLVLVFGYTSYRFNKPYALAAALMVALNDHFFFSGVNRSVLINGAVIAFIFSASYNFWEANVERSAFRYSLGLIFLFQALANKLQVVYLVTFLFILSLCILRNRTSVLRDIVRSKVWVAFISISLLGTFLWYLKNIIVTGNPVFPALAGPLHTFGVSPEYGKVFYKVVSGVSPSLFIKYMNYLFIWPGINASKIVITVIAFLPFILLVKRFEPSEDRGKMKEFLYWLSLCILLVMGIALACHWDPRYHRYPLAVMAFTAVMSIDFVLTALGIRKKVIIATILLMIALRGGANEGYKVVFDQGGAFMRPSVSDNVDTFLNKIDTSIAVSRVYPSFSAMLTRIAKERDKFDVAAYDVMAFPFPLFFLPVRPVVSPWHSTTVRWDSYVNASSVLSDLSVHRIAWIMQAKDSQLVFVPAQDYAVATAAAFEKRPAKKYMCYDLPRELCDVAW